MACCVSLLSCREENDPDPKSGQDLDPDKLVCTTSCWAVGYIKPTKHFCALFVVFVPDSTTFAFDPRVVESVTGFGSSGTPL